MALQGSGAISLDDMHVEAGGTTGTQCSLNDSDIRAMISKADGAQASFSEYYNAASEVDIALTISSNTNNYNIYSNRGGSYSAGKSNVTLTINSGVTVGSTSTGTYALDTGTGWSSGDTITIINNGLVKGRGGNGGNGGSVVWNSSVTNGTNGGGGGHALRAQYAVSVTNNGTIAGGGGGGGGGGSYWYDDTGKLDIDVAAAGGGGGGGAGVNGGSGGSGGSASGGSLTQVGTSGASGTATAGGAAGSGDGNTNTFGGAGGGLGANGGTGATMTGAYNQRSSGRAGGTKGRYITGNSNVTWTVSGTRLGGTS